MSKTSSARWKRSSSSMRSIRTRVLTWFWARYISSRPHCLAEIQKAISYLEKGSRLGPDNELMRLHLAEAYAQAHRNEDARKQIDALLAMKPVPGFETEYNEAVARARKLQEKLK